MTAHQGERTSAWTTRPRIVPPPLLQDERADVCIVGSGIAGLTTAYLAALDGQRVAVLDDGPVAGGQTERTTAHLAYAIDDRFVEIERLHGLMGLRIAAESHRMAIDRIERVVSEESIECGFQRVDGYLYAPPEEEDDLLARELEAAHRAGLADVERVTRAPLDGFDTGPALRFPRHGQLHPLAYAHGLADAITRRGGRLWSGARVTGVHGGREAHVITESGRRVSAGAIVVATNSPVNDRVEIHTKQAPYVSYVIAMVAPRGTPQLLLWDTCDPYHYVRLHQDDDGTMLLIVGGEDHKTAQEDDAPARYAALESWTRARFAGAGETRYRWSGQVMETQDGVAFIGRNPLDDDNVFVATGDSGMGMTHGTIAGMLLTDLIAGRDNPWSPLYDPRRRAMGAVATWIRENANVAAQYGDWVTGGDVDDAAAIAPGSGAIIRRGGSKLAVFRDDHGQLRVMSAVCPHLGCIVRWNGNERTWDCPCHGSRFDRHGSVINGPANADLSPRSLDE